MKNKLCYITNKHVHKWTVYLYKILMLKQKVMAMLFVNIPDIYTAQYIGGSIKQMPNTSHSTLQHT